MDATHWQVLLSKDDQGGIDARLLQESPDGLDLIEVAKCGFGPFDTCHDVTDWLCRHWSPRAKLPLR